MKKNILIIILGLIVYCYSAVSIDIQNKLTNVNPFPTIDVGANTNTINNELNVYFTNNNQTNENGEIWRVYMIFANKNLGKVSQNLYKKFMWNRFGFMSLKDKITYFSYDFDEYSMDFEDRSTVRSQTNYEQKLPLVMKYLYTNHGRNYQIARVKNSYDDKKNKVDGIIYWEKSDGRIYSFTYTRLAKVSVSHSPLYIYRGFKNKNDFDDFIKMRNGDSLPSDAPSLSILTAEHKALEKQYGLLD